MTAIIDKVRKLLWLAESPNANEAALAAAKAQQLIDEHNLSAALLSLDGGASAEPDEPIEDFYRKGAPLDSQPRLETWRDRLATVVARANGCRTYAVGGTIAIVGRPSDADAVRYLFAYLAHEIQRLCDRDGKGCGRTWRNNYRIGVVDTVHKKLSAERERFKQEARETASDSTALVRVNTALARVEQRGSDVAAWLKSPAGVKLYSRSAPASAFDRAAREAGRKAGESIRIRRGKGALVNGKALTA